MASYTKSFTLNPSDNAIVNVYDTGQTVLSGSFTQGSLSNLEFFQPFGTVTSISVQCDGDGSVHMEGTLVDKVLAGDNGGTPSGMVGVANGLDIQGNNNGWNVMDGSSDIAIFNDSTEYEAEVTITINGTEISF